MSHNNCNCKGNHNKGHHGNDHKHEKKDHKDSKDDHKDHKHGKKASHNDIFDNFERHFGGHGNHGNHDGHGNRHEDHHEDNHSNNRINELKLEQARLWEDHFWKTRIVVQAAASSNACLAADIKTLYANQDELGANFGQLTRNVNAGKELAKELREHIRIAIEIVVAAIAGKSIDALYKQWQKNATAIAAVYHKYNRRIRFETLNKLMQGHLETTLAEAVAIIGGNCEDSVKKGDVALHHVREMADYINSKF